jgi:hypothetical protein
MQSFLINLDAAETTFKAQVKPLEQSGLLRYGISVLQTNAAAVQQNWYAVLEPDCDGWKQTVESAEKGPRLPCFLVEEIGEQIENHFKE